MGKLGAGITLLVVGAVLTFAVNIDIPGIGKDALGIILMAAGVLAILFWLMTENRYRHGSSYVEETPVIDDGVAPVRRRRRF